MTQATIQLIDAKLVELQDRTVLTKEDVVDILLDVRSKALEESLVIV